MVYSGGPTLALSPSGSSGGGLYAGSVPSALSGLGNMSAVHPSGAPLASQASLRRRSKLEIAEQFLANLRARGNLQVEEEAIKAHFESLPSR